MKKLIFIACLSCFHPALFGQKAKSKSTPISTEVKIPLSAARWDFTPGKVEFGNHKDVPAMKILAGGGNVILKDFIFADGTIEYDIDPMDNNFTGIYFRRVDDRETEYFYLRVSRAGNPMAMDAAQYAPYNKGVNLWDLFDHYQGPALIRKNEWNHVKLVVSGRQLLVYVNDMVRPTLQVPQLEGNTTEGGIAFSGYSAIANLVVKPGEVEGLPAREGFDPTHHDPRYIRFWQVTEPQQLPRGRELFEGDFAKPSVVWQNMNAERRGLVNITRLFGADNNGNRRFVWLRTKLISTSEQKRKISLGFSDEVWVYLNRQLLYVDKNIYTSPQMRKMPDGRISIENAEFNATLKAGENELLIGVANDFFGWGIVARLANMEGIEVSTSFPPPVEQPKDLSKYLGTYSSPEASIKITISAVNDVLMGQATGQPAVPLIYFGDDKFRLEQAEVELEFIPQERKLVLKEGNGRRTFTKE